MIGSENADAQSAKTPKKERMIAPTEMREYTNVLENGKPVENGVRYTDVRASDTVVRNFFPLKGKDQVVEFKEHFEKAGMPRHHQQYQETPIKTIVTPAGDTERTYKIGLTGSGAPDTLEFTHVSANEHAPRRNAPEYLGEINSSEPAIRENNPLAPEDTLIVEVPATKFHRAENLPETSMHTGEESHPEKQAAVFTPFPQTNLAIEDMRGDARAFIRNNTRHFQDWLAERKNWQNLSLVDWRRIQLDWEFLKHKMRKAAEYANQGSGSHDQVYFPDSFYAVDAAMATDFEMLGAVEDILHVGPAGRQ